MKPITPPSVSFSRVLVFASMALGSCAFAQTAPLDWGTCPFKADSVVQCANLSVPLDYGNPNGAKISVAVSRRPAADPSKRRGVLLLNPGGPGGPGLDLPQVVTSLFPQSVIDTYDLIGFDPRGIEYRTPVTCGLDPNEAILDFVPLTRIEGFDATVVAEQADAAQCEARSGKVLPYINTANTARDMDQIRQALGEQKISYFGYSYGTYLGAVYASLFPDSTDRVVLDSNVNPNWVWRTQFREWGLSFDVRFPDFLKYAAANDATYHFGTNPRKIRQEFATLAANLHKNPLQLPDGILFDDSWFRFVTFSLIYNDLEFPILAQFAQTVRDTPTVAAVYPLFQALGIVPTEPAGLPPDTYEVAGGLVECGDQGYSHDVEQFREEFALDSALFPMTASFSSTINPCAFLPTQPSQPRVSISSAGPSNILMLQNLRDPGTPYWGALGLRAALGSRARIVSVNQGGHGIYGMETNQCANDSVTNYLVSGTYPTLDPYCPAEPASTRSAVPHSLKDNDAARNEAAKKEAAKKEAAKNEAIRSILHRMRSY